MNRSYATDPNVLAAIHCGGVRLTRNSQAPMPSYLVPAGTSEQQKPASLSDQMTAPRWKSGR